MHCGSIHSTRFLDKRVLRLPERPMDANRRAQRKKSWLFRMRRQQYIDGFVTQIDDACSFRARLIRVEQDGRGRSQTFVEIERAFGAVDADGPVAGNQ